MSTPRTISRNTIWVLIAGIFLSVVALIADRAVWQGVVAGIYLGAGLIMIIGDWQDKRHRDRRD